MWKSEKEEEGGKNKMASFRVFLFLKRWKKYNSFFLLFNFYAYFLFLFLGYKNYHIFFILIVKKK